MNCNNKIDTGDATLVLRDIVKLEHTDVLGVNQFGFAATKKKVIY
jgi:hypothetical protein